ncbi:hypothetical protein FB451DRAFT_1360746 [Mycena latifolia]|nr:hypothetical protein FB451DRAFT_1360746 [Mycena latifolia]
MKIPHMHRKVGHLNEHDSTGPDGGYKDKVDPISEERNDGEEEGEKGFAHKPENMNAEMGKEDQIQIHRLGLREGLQAAGLYNTLTASSYRVWWPTYPQFRFFSLCLLSVFVTAHELNALNPQPQFQSLFLLLAYLCGKKETEIAQGNKSFVAFSNLNDSESLTKTWKVCTKVASYLEEGSRLENLSWRLWHLQNLMVDTDNAKSKREFKKLSKCTGDKLDKEKDRSCAASGPMRGHARRSVHRGGWPMSFEAASPSIPLSDLPAPDFKRTPATGLLRVRAAEKERAREAEKERTREAGLHAPEQKGNGVRLPALFSASFGPAALLAPPPSLAVRRSYGEAHTPHSHMHAGDAMRVARPTIELPLDELLHAEEDGEEAHSTHVSMGRQYDAKGFGGGDGHLNWGQGGSVGQGGGTLGQGNEWAGWAGWDEIMCGAGFYFGLGYGVDAFTPSASASYSFGEHHHGQEQEPFLFTFDPATFSSPAPVRPSLNPSRAHAHTIGAGTEVNEADEGEGDEGEEAEEGEEGGLSPHLSPNAISVQIIPVDGDWNDDSNVEDHYADSRPPEDSDDQQRIIRDDTEETHDDETLVTEWSRTGSELLVFPNSPPANHGGVSGAHEVAHADWTFVQQPASHAAASSRSKDNAGTKTDKSTLSKKLRNSFIALFGYPENCGVTLGRDNQNRAQLPWKKMEEVLAQHGLEISGWPGGVPAPGSYGHPDKGIFGWKAHHIRALHDAMTRKRIKFQPRAGGSHINFISGVREEDAEDDVDMRPTKKGKWAETRKRPKDMAERY